MFFQHRHAAVWAVINSVSLIMQDFQEKINLRGPDASLWDLNYLFGPAMASVGDPHLLHLGSSAVNKSPEQPGLGKARS